MEAQELLPSGTQLPFLGRGGLGLVSIQSQGTGGHGKGPRWHSLGGVCAGAGGGAAPVPPSPVRLSSGQDRPPLPGKPGPGAVSPAQLGSSCP